MLTRWQRWRGFGLYLARPARNFAPLFAGFVVVVLAGGLCFQHLYTEQPLTLPRALYITYALVFMEHLLPFPKHWLLQLFYVVLPPLGLAVLLDGIVQFSVRILRRDAHSSEWNLAMIKTLDNHIILLGLGKAGLRVLQHLLQMQEQVCVLEKDVACPGLAFAQRNGVPVLIGNSRQEGVLDELGVQQARAIILATDDDLCNIEMALDARKARPDINVVLRVFDQELANKIRDSFGIYHTFSTTTLAAPLFATSALDPSIVNAFDVAGHMVVVARIEVTEGAGLAGQRVDVLSRELPLFVLAIERAQEASFRPREDEVIAVGDALLLQCEPATLRAVHAMNSSGATPA